MNALRSKGFDANSVTPAPSGTSPVGTSGITATQVAYGSGVNTIKGQAAFTYVEGTGVLSLGVSGSSNLATITGNTNGALSLVAGGTNQNLTLNQSGSGFIVNQLTTSKFVVNEFSSDGFVRLHALATATTPTSATAFLSYNGGTTLFLGSTSASGTVEFQRNGTTSLVLSGGASATLTGGAGNMTITAGTGNSRILNLQTTTSGGVATTAVTFDATQNASFTNNITLAGTALITKPGGVIPLITTNTAITDQAGASTGTLLNAPSAGNPSKWILINDNGTVRKIPTWT